MLRIWFFELNRERESAYTVAALMILTAFIVGAILIPMIIKTKIDK